MEDEHAFHKEIIEGLATVKQVTADILEQVRGVHGRVNRHDELHHEHRVKFALIEQSKVQTNWWKDATGKALVTMIFMIVGAAVMLILQKTDIVDVSTVSASDYEQIDFITSSYGENNP